MHTHLTLLSLRILGLSGYECVYVSVCVEVYVYSNVLVMMIVCERACADLHLVHLLVCVCMESEDICE